MRERRRHQLIAFLASSLVRLVTSRVASAADGLAAAIGIGHTRRPENDAGAPDVTTEHAPDTSAADRAPDDLPDSVPNQSAPEPEMAKDCDVTTEAAQDASTEIDNKEDVEPATFDFDAFFMRILTTRDLYATLDVMAREIRNRGDEACGIERFFLRQLEEERLIQEKIPQDGHDTPSRTPVQPTLLWRNGSVYLRMGPNPTYGTYLQALRAEALLNVIRLAQQSDIDASRASVEDMYRLRQRFQQSVCSQSPFVDTADWSFLVMPWQGPVGPAEHGEWSVRHAIAEAAEGVRLPYRLDMQYRTNVAGGDIAIEISHTPSRAFPHTTYIDGLGIVPTTNHMRRRMASEYAVRVGFLMAAHAFHASNRITRVWVSTIEQTPSKRRCLYSICLERRTFAALNMHRLQNPLQMLIALGGSACVENEALAPSDPCFALEDERFCPPVRHDLWRLSERALPASATRALGTSRVSGLIIHEELPRVLAAEEAMRNMATEDDPFATERSVRAVLTATGNTSDPDVWSAAEFVVGELIDGSLEPTDSETLYERFVMRNDARVGLEQAQKKLRESGAAHAIHHLERALEPSSREGRYLDTPVIAYRSFGSFVERVLHNRASIHDTRSVVLVPDDYVAAHLSISALSLGPDTPTPMVERALQHAHWALERAPYSATAHQTKAACLERLGRYEEACDQLKSYLAVAYQSQGIGIAYHRLAALFHQLGEPRVCQACYQRCLQAFPELMPVVLAECQELVAEGASFEDAMEPDIVDAVLEGAGVPLAPTGDVIGSLFEASVAAIDAQVFPVARDLMRTVASLTHDDVILDIYRSIENEPDA